MSVSFRATNKNSAERIRGRWVSGDELSAIIEKARKLHAEGVELLKGNQTLQAIKKLEEAQSIYPNSFASAFVLGYLYTLQKDDAKALLASFKASYLKCP